MYGPVIYKGDWSYVLETIEDNSIDLIITDPLWSKKTIHIYEALTIASKRVLKNNGAMIILTGGIQDDEIISAVKKQGMKRQTDFVFFMEGNGVWVPGTHVKTNHRKAMCFIKNENENPRVISKNACILAKKDKRFHDYGQPADLFILPVSELCNRSGNTIVLDPFLGGGACGIAAVSMGCSFIGIERNEKNYQIASNRIQKFYDKIKVKTCLDPEIKKYFWLEEDL